MCYGWEPDDIVQIITDLKKDNEMNSLEIIGKALEKTAIGLGEKYRSKDYPNINLSNYITRFYDSGDKNLFLIKNEPNEAIMKTNKCKISLVSKIETDSTIRTPAEPMEVRVILEEAMD